VSREALVAGIVRLVEKDAHMDSNCSLRLRQEFQMISNVSPGSPLQYMRSEILFDGESRFVSAGAQSTR
jgi:hypothetical protein